MANIITYPTVTPASTDLVIGNYINTDGISETKTFTVASIAASGGGGSSVTSLNDLTDCLIDTASEYIGTVPSGLSGNPQGNTTLGIGAGDDITTGNKNTLIGSNAGPKITSGIGNVLLGKDTLTTSNTNYVVAVGEGAANIATGNNGIHIGYYSGRTNSNTAHVSIGHLAGYSNTSGAGNVNLGYSAGYTNTFQLGRVCIGYYAGFYNTGAENTFIGYEAGKGSSSVNSVGGQNTAIGKHAGQGLTTGYFNVLIGKDAGSTLTTAQNSIVIGYDAEPSAATTSNEITLGNANITSLRIPGLQSGATDGDVLTFSSSTNNITLKSASLTKLVTVTSAQILALSGGVNDFELIPAPGAGKIIMIDSVLAFLDFNSVGYTITGTGGIFLKFGIGGGASDISSFVDDTSDSYLNFFSRGVHIENPLVNVALKLRNNSNVITLGNSPIKFNIVYRILDATTLA